MHLNREGLNARPACCDAVEKSISSTGLERERNNEGYQENKNVAIKQFQLVFLLM